MLYEMDDSCCKEAEDFMCDQVIFSTEVDFKTKRSNYAISTTKLRVAIEIIANSLLPTVSNVYYAYMRNQKFVVENVRKIIIPTVLAVLANYLSQSLSSVQKRISTPRLEHSEFRIDNDHTNGNGDTPEKCVECNVLNEPLDIKADIIFIHGLHGALNKTWRQGMWRHEHHKINRLELIKSPSLKRQIKSNAPFVVLNKVWKKSINQSINNSLIEEHEHVQMVGQGCDYSQCWPAWLDKDCPGARVIALNYTTDPYLWRPIWVKKRNRTGMIERSREMIEHLREIGVASSQTDISDIFKQSKAILFYSVPHRGSIMADFSLPLLSKSVELTEVQKNCKFVLELHDKFLKLFEHEHFKPEVFSFIETSFTLMSFIYLKIVSFESADPGIGEICGVPLDHREICKPAGRDCFLYKELVQLIDKVLRNDKT